ncbi:TonB-dependent receptor [Sinomicrobium oceani]|uniref:TonB-dependent receptor n=1 Tax=Sinomicrobium oceani TaxID=1150368 RepID=UPI00227A6E36|nr:TonB-dependent receptor [Sinomicrobium oceani]
MQDRLYIIFIFFAVFSFDLHDLRAQERVTKDSLAVIELLETIVVGDASPGAKRIVGKREYLDDEKINMVRSQTLGAALSHIPGVQNSYFGPNSGTPVIRSMSGNRVKVLSNGAVLNNLSGISPNLDVQIDTDNLLGIEVYKGNAAVLYGGRAIGGAVNMHDNTIPSALFPEEVQGHAIVEAGTNSGYRQAVNINGNLGKYWAWHIGGMNRRNDDLKIPGNTKAPIAYDPDIDDLTQSLAQVYVDAENIRNLSLYPYLSQYVMDRLGDPKWGLTQDDLYTFDEYSYVNGENIRNPDNEYYVAGQDPDTPLYNKVVHGIYDYAPVTKGIMPNSHARSKAVNFGTSYIRNNFRMGIGYRYVERYYGIPGFALTSRPSHNHGHDHSHDHNHHTAERAHEYAPINTSGISHSTLLESEYKPVETIFSTIRLNYVMQVSDDRELVGSAPGNKFDSNRHTVRIEAEQKAWKFGKGLSGIDYAYFRMKGEGEQRYLPNNQSREFGVFTLQQLNYHSLMLNLGYRYDRVSRRVLSDPDYKTGRGLAGGELSDRNFGLNQFTGDLRWNFWKAGFMNISFNHAERAPEVNELYAGNDHFAIMIEENGDDRLDKETARTYEFGGGVDYGRWHASLTYYHTFFEDYLYLAHTGISRSGGFLVKEWRGSDTEISGWEATLNYRYTWDRENSWEISSFFDLVKNKNTSDDPVRKWAEGDYMPNLPTSRYNFSSTIVVGKFLLYMAFERYGKQRYLGKNINPEPPMPAYSLLSGRFAYRFQIKQYALEVYAFGSNLLNTEARPQNSYLKYLAPLPGRNITIGLKAIL